MTRTVTHRYLDPLEAVWLAAARGMGLHVVRDEEVFASTDGRGTLRLGTTATLDPDDNAAQMIFHEICHWLVEGEGAVHLPDWGLENLDDRDLWRERAALRVQAALSSPHGLRHFLAPTTEHRAFYDALPEDPLQRAEPRVAERVREALARAETPPWAPHLERALRATAVIAGAVRQACAHRVPPSEPPLLWALTHEPVTDPSSPHTLPHPSHFDEEGRIR